MSKIIGEEARKKGLSRIEVATALHVHKLREMAKHGKKSDGQRKKVLSSQLYQCRKRGHYARDRWSKTSGKDTSDEHSSMTFNVIESKYK